MYTMYLVWNLVHSTNWYIHIHSANILYITWTIIHAYIMLTTDFRGLPVSLIQFKCFRCHQTTQVLEYLWENDTFISIQQVYGHALPCWQLQNYMMTSSNGNIFRVTGHLCGEFTGPVNPSHKGQWRGALVFSLICAGMNGWENNRQAGDLRRQHARYDVTVM